MIPDVLVVGAGPAGSAAAALLAREGFQVILADKSQAPPAKICGEYLSPGGRRILRDLGILEALERSGAPAISGITIHTLSGRTLAAEFPPDPEGHPCLGLAARREFLDPLLLDLARQSGAVFLPGLQASDLILADGAVLGVQGRLEGRPQEIRARLVIGADGRGSVVARRLGAVRPHRWLEKFAVGGYFSGVDRAAGRCEIFVGRRAYCILDPVADGLTNAASVEDRGDSSGRIRTAEDFIGTLGRIHPDLPGRFARARPEGGLRTLGPLAHRAERMGFRGALLVGDAAGFLDPFTGEGIYSALRSAQLAAEHAARALRQCGDGPPDLQSYDTAWRREFLPKWRICMGIQHAVRRPFLAHWIVGRLQGRRALAQEILAAVGDLLPAQELGLGRLALRTFRALRTRG